MALIPRRGLLVKTRSTRLAILCLTLAATPALAQVLYDNGPLNGTINAWVFNFGFTVSDTFTLASDSTAGGFEFVAWEFPGDVLQSVDWSITTQENAGNVLGSGTASGQNLTDTFLFVNRFGFDIDKITVTGLDAALKGGTYWLNLQNASVSSGDPVYWDENDGVDCGGSDGKGGNCPSLASDTSIGTIFSETFTVTGAGTTPEPGSMVLLGSGIVSLGGVLRRKML